MKYFKQTMLVLLVMFMMITSLPVVRAEDGELPEDTEITAVDENPVQEEEPVAEDEIPPFEPAPILNPPLDYSLDLTIDENTDVASGELLNSRLRRKLEEDIDKVLNFQPIDSEDVGEVLHAVDKFLVSGGFDKTSHDVGTGLLGNGELGRMANAIGLQETGEDLIEVID
ncbi:MAG: hypothetical protein IIY57_06355, partial [Erysipelotrichaceae bacterium]|nr:hypothetical protein [Erysipelotrichaceae bacterium]